MEKKLFNKFSFLICSLCNLGFLVFTKPVFAGITNPVAGPFGSGSPQNILAVVIANIWKAAFILGSIFCIFYFVWGAIRWMTAEGDKTKFEEGRHKIANALIGLILLAASVAIIQLIGTLFDIQFLRTLIFEFPTP